MLLNYVSLAVFFAKKIKISLNTDQLDVPKKKFNFNKDTFVINTAYANHETKLNNKLVVYIMNAIITAANTSTCNIC